MANLRYRNARNSADLLGQVFTPPAIAQLLAKKLATENHVGYLVDLGAGEGALSLPVMEKNRRLRGILVEIDKTYASRLKSLSDPRVQVMCMDALVENWKCPEHPSVILSNPPYGTVAAPPDVRKMLDESGLDIPLTGDWARGDVAFLARAWGIAATGCHLGFIVASPVICDAAYRKTRSRIITGLRGLCVTRLHESTFPQTEVSSFLFTGQRAVSRKRRILLRKALRNGEIIEETEVDFHSAMISLDIDYHLSLKRLGIQCTKNLETLGEIGVQITRGSRSKKDYERLGLRAFHTTDFSDLESEVVLRGAAGGYQIAEAGDILIPRVGTRCLARQAIVRKGIGLFTDCVYRVKIPRRNRRRVWETLSSPFGVDWRLCNAGGSCAKHLTISTLLGMPLLR